MAVALANGYAPLPSAACACRPPRGTLCSPSATRARPSSIVTEEDALLVTKAWPLSPQQFLLSP